MEIFLNQLFQNSSYLKYSKSALADAVSDLDALTHAEGFDAHFQSVKVRLNA